MMPNILDGSVAIVAGGARGIGRASALRLADLGARVAVLDLDLDAAAEYGEELTAASVEDELRDRAGEGMAIPVGGAITPYPRSLASITSDDDFSTLVDVNMRTVVNCCRSGVPYMREGGGGAIVTVASGAALAVDPGGFLAAYAMTKAAVLHYTRYLAAEVGQWGIRVNCIAPGVIRTARVVAQSAVSGVVNDDAAKSIPLGRQGEPSDIADAVQYFVTPLSAYITGQVLAVDGGSTMH
jgi:3-oxoacyl-[acyl-carrier protein] reductase